MLIWHDRGRSPRKVAESLKTSDPARARSLKVRLEYQYQEGNHDPWRRKWYDHHSDELLDPALSECLESFIRDRVERRGRRSWNETTKRQTESVLHRFVDHAGDPLIRHLDRQHLRSFYDRPPRDPRRPRSPHTTAFERRIIRSFCRWLHEKGMTRELIDVEIDPPQDSLPEYLSDQMLEQVYAVKAAHIYANLKYCRSGDGSRHIDAWKLAASTGVRKSEIGSLRLDANRGDTIIVGYRHRTKSGKQRAVPLLFEASEILQKYTDPAFREADPHLASSDLLFGRSRQGIDRMAREFSRCCRQLWPGRPELSFHSLRHTFAIRYLTAPGNGQSNDFRLVKLQMILGHADISTTMKYLKIDPARLGI